MDEEVLAEREAAAFLKRSTRTLERLRKSKAIPLIPGKPVTYLKSSLITWLKSREVKAEPASEAGLPPILPSQPQPRTRSNSEKAVLLDLCLAVA